MTAAEMHKYVLQRINVMQGELDVVSEDVERAINKAIDQFIKQRYQKEANPLREGFEMSQVRVSDLRSLIADSGAITPEEEESDYDDDIFIDKASLPNDFMFLLKVGAKIQYNSNGIDYSLSGSQRVADGTLDTDYAEMLVPCKYVQLDDIQQISSDPFNKPQLTSPKFTVNDNFVYVYTDENFVTKEVHVTYLKEPTKVDLEAGTACDLAESTHEDIVEMAANFLLQSRGATQEQSS